MKDLFIKIRVVQKRKREGHNKSFKYRINPFNPLSYLTLVIAFVLALLGYGFIGMWEYVNFNPFKWQ